MSQDALREGDDFFDECADWMAATAMQRPVYNMPGQMPPNYMYYPQQHYQQLVWPAWDGAGIATHIHAQESTALEAEHCDAFDQFLRDTDQA